MPIADVWPSTRLNWLVADQTDPFRVNRGLRRALLFVLLLTLTSLPPRLDAMGTTTGDYGGSSPCPMPTGAGIATTAKLHGATPAAPCVQRPPPIGHREAATPGQTWCHQIGNYSPPIQT